MSQTIKVFKCDFMTNDVMIISRMYFLPWTEHFLIFFFNQNVPSLKCSLKAFSFLFVSFSVPRYVGSKCFLSISFSQSSCGQCKSQLYERRLSYFNKCKYLDMNSVPLRMHMCLLKRFLSLNFSLSILFTFYNKICV